MILVDVCVNKYGEVLFLFFNPSEKSWNVKTLGRSYIRREFLKRICNNLPCKVNGDLEKVDPLTEDEVYDLLISYGHEFVAKLRGNYIRLELILIPQIYKIRKDYSFNAYRLYKLLEKEGPCWIRALVCRFYGNLVAGLTFQLIEPFSNIPKDFIRRYEYFPNYDFFKGLFGW